MNKIILKILIAIFGVFLFAGVSFAANSTSIRLQQPDSPTNKDSFDIVFVALDTNSSQPVSVQCYKKGPVDGAFSAFDSIKNLSNGGNTDNCQVTPSVMNEGNGTYQFYAQVVTGSTTPASSTVNVDFNNSTPGTPINYSKIQQNSCTYQINFKTADDSGKTVKVSLFRSTNTSFGIDSSNLVDTLSIGSNTNGSFTNTVADCDKTNYFAIRAFDAFGNGSGVVGDQGITTTVVNSGVTTTATQTNAIPVTNSQVGEVSSSPTESSNPNQEVLGTQSAKTSPSGQSNTSKGSILGTVSNLVGNKVVLLILGVAFLIAVAHLFYRRRIQ